MPKAEGKRRSQNPLERARDAGLDSLFSVHPKGFVAARNAVADALKKGGDAEAAGAVRSMAKPTVPVWAVNQVARSKTKEVEALLEVSAQLRKAQQGKAGDFRALSERHRELVKQLRSEAARILEVAPTSTSANLDRAEHTLLAAAAGTETQREQLAKGELREELVAAGFDVFGGFGGGFTAAAAAEPVAKARAAPAKAAEEKRPAAKTPEDKQSSARERAEAARQAKEAAKAAKEAEREALASARASEARAAADAAEREASAIAQQVKKAEADHAAAEEALQAAKARFDQTEEALKAARAEHKKAEATAARLAKSAGR